VRASASTGDVRPATAGSVAAASLDGLRVLPWARAGSDVVPGAPERVRALADELDAVARGLMLMRHWVQEVPSVDWAGPAAALFGAHLREQPARYQVAAEALGSSASAMRGHAAVLQVAQEEAEEAVRLDLAAAQATRRWLVSGGPSSTVGSAADPGAAARHRVTEGVATARSSVRASAASTADRLRAAAGRAPDRPMLALRAARSAVGFGRDVDQGLRESVSQALGLAVRLDPGRAVRQPGLYRSDVTGDAAAAGRLVLDPARLGRAVLDLDTAQESPGRWIGHLLPDLALALGTAGAAPVAERTATATLRAATRVGPASVRRPLADAVASQTARGRSPLRLRDVRSHVTAPDVAGHRTVVAPVDHAVGRRVARDARWAERQLTPRLDDVAHELRSSAGSGQADVRLRGLDHVVKGEDSLLRKLATESRQRGVAGPRLATGLNDTVRYAITLPDDSYVRGAVDTVSAMQRRGLRLTAAKSFWGSERYQGLNLTFHDGLTGRPIELQLHTPGSWQASVDTHVDYEWFRSEGVSPALRADHRRRIAARFAAVHRPDGVETLGDLLVPHAGPARMTAPQLRSLPGVQRAVLLSTGAHSARSLACGG
jgi:hypothetical protein